MCRFYGWTIEYVESLTYNQYLQYFKAALVIDSQERLQAMEVASYPNISKKHDRKSIVRKLEKPRKMYLKGSEELKSYDSILKSLKDQVAKARKQGG